MRPIILALAVAAMALPLGAQQRGATRRAASTPTTPSVRIDYVRETLPNGLTVIYHVDRSTPVVAVDIWYAVGSKHEQPGRTGFAHLFEHMMFKGSRNVPDGQHFALLEAAGGRAGADINGTTSNDRTNYFEQVPSNQLELALWLEADRMGTLLETLTPEKLENQREVVKNERRQGVDNQPYGTWFEKSLTYMFPEGHPYHHSVIGSMEDLSAASVDDVKNFFRMYYSPDNATLVVAGDIDVPEAKRLVRKHFAGLSRGPARPPLRSLAVPEILGKTSREVVEDANARAPAVYMTFRVPPARDPRATAVDLLGTMLGSGRSSPLYSSLVRDKQLAANVFMGNFGLIDGADVMVVGAIGKPGSNADSLEAAVLDFVQSAESQLTAEHLDRARAVSRFGFINQLQSTGGFGGRADRLAEGRVFHGDPNWVNTRLQRWDSVTLEQIKSLARSHFVAENRVTLVYLPKAATSTPKVVPE